jgi:ribosomal protein L11 methyltransferase
MFFALGRLRKPQDFINARATMFDWASAGEKSVCFAGINYPAQLETRTLAPDHLNALDLWLEQAWQGTGFGGYTRQPDSEDLTGIVHFGLDATHTEARLLALITEPDATGLSRPLQNAVLYAALHDLQRESPYLERVYLGFEDNQADAEWLFAVDLKPGSVPGWWEVVFEEETPAQTPVALAAEGTNWLELSVRAEPEAVEAITELFARYGYNQGVVIEEAVQAGPDGGAVVDANALVTIRTYVSVADANIETLEKVREGLFYLGKLRQIEELQVTERREEDWANAWKEFYQVHRVGRRSVIKPPWQPFEAQPGDVVIEIDPGMAFGTGLHPTTRLCLQLLEDRLDPQVHAKALDLGTGSGILAIAAAKMGVAYTVGVDTDPVAVRAARENIERNGLLGQIVVEAGSLAIERDQSEGGFYSFAEDAQKPPAVLEEALPYDLIIANIIARVLIALAVPMVQALRPGGLLICSGIIAEKADAVVEALAAAGLQNIERRVENDWVALVGDRG